jgi:hypothetical protein
MEGSMTASLAFHGDVPARLAPAKTYNLPKELARQVWRLACEINDQRDEGASESALMEVAWEMFIALPDAEASALIERTFARQGRAAEYRRKSYSLPADLVRRVNARVNELREYADARRRKEPSLWLAAEAAQIHFVEMLPHERERAIEKFGVRKKRRHAS